MKKRRIYKNKWKDVDHKHTPYYCLVTGGMRCRKCKVLLNDYCNEYK